MKLSVFVLAVLIGLVVGIVGAILSNMIVAVFGAFLFGAGVCGVARTVNPDLPPPPPPPRPIDDQE